MTIGYEAADWRQRMNGHGFQLDSDEVLLKCKKNEEINK